MGRDKSLQARLEKPDLGAASDHEPTRHQPLPAPARHRAGRHVVPPAHLVDRQDRLVHLLDRLTRRRRQVFDEQPQVMLNIPPIKHQGWPTLGPIPRDPVTQIFIGVTLRPLDLAQELLGPLDLLEPPFPRRVPRLLIFQLLHRGMAVRLAHPGSPPVTVRFAFEPPQMPTYALQPSALLSTSLPFVSTIELPHLWRRKKSESCRIHRRPSTHLSRSSLIQVILLSPLPPISPTHPPICQPARIGLIVLLQSQGRFFITYHL